MKKPVVESQIHLHRTFVLLRQLTKRQERQQDYHVQADHQSTPLCRCNLREEKRSSDSQRARAETTKDSREQHEPIDSGREDLHQDPRPPNAYRELVRAESANAIVEDDGRQRPERSSQHAKRRDVGLPVCEF